MGSRRGEMAQRHRGTKAQRKRQGERERLKAEGRRLKVLELIVIVIVIERKGVMEWRSIGMGF